MLTENKLVYLLSSKNWSESLYRMRNIRTIESYLFRQIRAMSYQSKKIGIALEQIREEQTELQHLLSEEESSIKSLENDEALKDQILANLESDQAKLKFDLEKQRKARESLNREIEKTILIALTGSNSTSYENENKSSGLKTENLKQKFSRQKKLLPWPVDKGVIVSTFGRQKHPSLKDVIISNNGIDISSTTGNSVKAVFDGIVVRVMQITANNMMIILKHGEYFTDYSRISEVQVAQGQHVETGQILGSLAETGEAILHFQVWKDKIKLDPQDWLRKQNG
jgi:septal ring factor EnvC (AmiA/AmiB activator)